MASALKLAKCLMNIIYTFFKLLPVQHKVTIISRQSDSKTLDIMMLEEGLKAANGSIKVVCLCKTIKKSLLGIMAYMGHIISQMYHISTSKAVVIDSYCIGVSMLKHRKTLKVIQMWHALGSLKRFGYSIFGLKEGRDESVSKIMNMHGNYHTVFTSSSFCVESFAEAFGYNSEYIKVYPLPRVDVLKDKKHTAETAEKIFKVYPQLTEKKNIVYAPTFRVDKNLNDIALEKLVEVIDYDQYNLIVKEHPLMKVRIKQEGVITDNKFSSIDMFCIADYIVLDYSAIVYEAALMEKPMFFYAFDLDDYTESRSFYIDYKNEMPGMVSCSASDIIDAVKSDKYDIESVKAFSQKYVEKQENCTEHIVEYILELIG